LDDWAATLTTNKNVKHKAIKNIKLDRFISI
jgi:hypothetical protein